jgi:hypothetical protein
LEYAKKIVGEYLMLGPFKGLTWFTILSFFLFIDSKELPKFYNFF